MPHHCCVPGCTSNTRLGKCTGISFHKFPVDPNVSKQWTVKIRRENFEISKDTRVCGLHFEDSSYHPQVPGTLRKRLKKNSLPTVFVWNTTPKPKRRRLFRDRTVKKQKAASVTVKQATVPDHSYHRRGAQPTTDSENEIELQGIDHPVPSDGTGHRESDDTFDSLENVECDPSPSKEDLYKKLHSLLLSRAQEKFTVLRFCSSDSDIRFYTGFPSFECLSAFFHFLQPVCNFLKYVGSEPAKTPEEKSYILYSKRGPSRSLSPLEELFLTLVRLRKGLQEKVIADLYNLSEGHVSKVINTWILFLFDRLRFLPIWPTREHVKSTMPDMFKKDYGSTRVIIDCTEIFIEQPSAAGCQRETFSSYKHHNTAKGMIGIAPSGQITFISSLYAGRCSDKKIVRHCGLYDILEEGDAVMTDKGFDIKTDLENIGCELAMPPFLEKQTAFTKVQLKETKDIAALRVHVERAVRKVKEFEIIKNTVPISICPMLEKTWFVCCHLANFSGSLFKREE